MNNTKYKCPKCGGEKFSATAHVCQDWMLDNNGDFIESIENCSQVLHKPDEDDLWECLDCGYDGIGSKFKCV